MSAVRRFETCLHGAVAERRPVVVDLVGAAHIDAGAMRVLSAAQQQLGTRLGTARGVTGDARDRVQLCRRAMTGRDVDAVPCGSLRRAWPRRGHTAPVNQPQSERLDTAGTGYFALAARRFGGPMLDDALLTLSLPQRPEAASAARKALAALNGDLHLISSERLADAQLLVTELVTNAVRASTTDAVQLRVQATDKALRVEVANSGGPFDPATLPMPTSLRAGGWGLRIVDVVAKRWGVERTEAGVNVWFELDRPSSPTSLPLSGEAPPPAAHAQRPQRMSTSE